MPSGLTLKETAAASIPTPSADKVTLFCDSADGLPKYKNDGGTSTSLVGATGATGAAGPTYLPVNSQSTAYTAVIGDAGGLLLHPSSDANARTFTIPANGSVAYTTGTTLTFVNETSQVLTIAITTDTLKLVGTGSTGSRSLAQHGVATAVKIASTLWYISGTGIT
jgi:hypothetical protein